MDLYEGGMEDMAMKDMDMDMGKKEEVNEEDEFFKAQSVLSISDIELDQYDWEDESYCCCTYQSAMTVYTVILLFLAFLIFLDICTQAENKYMPVWYPSIGLFLFFILAAGLVLVSMYIWEQRDKEKKRILLQVGAWTALGAVIALFFLNIVFAALAHKVRVGSGDNDDDYDEWDKSSYFISNLFWLVVLVTIIVQLLVCIYGHLEVLDYKENKNKKDDDDSMDGDSDMDEKDKDK